MAKKKSAHENPPDAPGDHDVPAEAPRDPDLVVFYSRLTHTLENRHGRDTLAQILTEARQSPEPPEEGPPFASAAGVFFRRIGFVGPGEKTEAFVEDFAKRVGEAVSRPDWQVLFLLRLFALGDDARGLKPVCGPTPQCQVCQLTKSCDHYNNPRKPAMPPLPPAARLMAGNDAALSDAELLGVVLHGEKGTGMEPVVATLLARYGRLRAVFRADGHEFAGIRGMSDSLALRLTAIAGLHRRLLAERRGAMLRITCSRDIYDRYAAELRDYRVEAAVLLMLDGQNHVIRDVWFCDGSPTLAQVGVADLLRPAIREFAARVALVHNHPGNDPRPSLADVDFTRRLRAACDTLGLDLVDHVIVAESGCYSFAEEGMLRG